MNFDDIFASLREASDETKAKAERERRGRLAEQIHSQKHPDDPMTLDEARTLVDLAAKVWEDTEQAILDVVKHVPERLATPCIAVSVKTVYMATESLLNFILERASQSDDSCDCDVCTYRREIAAGVDPKDHPLTAQLLGMGYRVVDSGDGFIVLEGSSGTTFH